MGRRKPMTIRQRAYLSPTGTVCFEEVSPAGEHKAKAVDASGRIVGRSAGIQLIDHDGATIRDSGEAQDCRGGIRFQVRMLLRTMRADKLASFVSYWAKQGIRLSPCYTRAAVGVEPSPLREDYRDEEGLYVWSVSGGDEESIRRLGQSEHVALLRQGILTDGSGGSLEYRRLQDSRKHEKG